MRRKHTHIASIASTALLASWTHADIKLEMRKITGGTGGSPGDLAACEEIWALAAPDSKWIYDEFIESPDPANINVAGSGSYSPTNVLPNGNAADDAYALRATANLVIPVGLWTIGFGSDDGGRLRIPGITFTTKVNDNSGGGSPADEVHWTTGRGHNWTFGQFEVTGSPLTTTIDAIQWEGGGGDSYEIAFASGHQGSFNAGTWNLLEDGVDGWTVQVAPINDTDPPVIDTLSPADDATGTNPFGSLVATFDEDIAEIASGTIILTDLTDASDNRTITLPDGQVSISGTELTVSPTTQLEYGTEYQVTISGADNTGGAGPDTIEDTWMPTANIFGGTVDGEWTFTTAAEDLTAPVIVTYNPADDSTGVVPNATLTASFDDSIALGTGNITLVDTDDASGNQVIAVTDATQVSISGSDLIITPSTLLEGGANYAVQIDAGVVTNFSNVGFAGIADTTTWNFSVSSATIFVTDANTGTNSDTWTAGANWNIGSQPSGILAAVIDPGLTALANSVDVLAYSGGLSIGAGSTVQVGSGGSTEGRTQSANAIGTGPITMESGSKIQWQMKVSPTLPDLTLNGDASIVTDSNESHGRNFNFSAISGAGQLTFLGTNNQTHTFDTASPGWSGGFVSGVASSARTRFVAAAEGVFGTGNVTVGNRTDLQINNNNGGAGNAIDDSATLAIEGIGRDQSSTDKLIMNGSETVDLLTVDGFPYPAGTYGRPGLGGVDTELDLITGNSILTVTSEPTDSTPPTATFDAVGAGGSTTDVFETEPVTYTVTFSEPLSSAPVVGDFENSTATAITVSSVNDVSPNPLNPNLVFEVAVTATEPGTLNLQIKSGSVLEDLFGNALVVPAPDNDTLTVNAYPDLTDGLGIWKPWSNGGINPATGAAWAAGDNFVGAFVSDGTRDATAPDRATYDAFVQAEAGTAGWGGVTWYAVVSCYDDPEYPNYNPARDNNNPSMTTSNAILLPNGAKLADDGADLANGPDIPFNITQSGATYGGSVGTGGGRMMGDPGQSNIEHGDSNRTDGGWYRVFNGSQSSQWHIYALSEELTLTSTGGGNPFDTWAGSGSLGPVTFAGDTNGDGVQDGMAFLLGVANPDDDANGNLPAVSEDGSGNLVMTFECLAIADRGTATLNVQHSGDLSAWAPLPNGVLVPDASGGPTDGVTFVVGDGSDGPGGLNGVTATIDSSLASGGKLFGRLNGTE